MLKLVRNKDNQVQVSVSSTIDLSGYTARITIKDVTRAVSSLVGSNIYFDITSSDVESLGDSDYLAPIEVINSTDDVYLKGLVSMRAVDTEEEAIGCDKIYLIIVGDYTTISSGSGSLEEEIAARKAGDIAVLANAKTYTNEKIKKSKLFVYAGQVATVADLPETADVGEVYNVIETGANYAWNGTEWDKLSEDIDLSKFATKEQLDSETTARTNADSSLQTSITENAEAISSLGTTVAQKADKTALESLQTEVGTLSTAVGTKAAQADLEALETVVGGKAAQTDLESLATTVSGKASQTDLDSLSETVGKKASQDDLDALETTVDGKASKESVETLTTTVNGKASQTELNSLKETVDGKASQSDLESLASTVSGKASQTDLENLSTTVDGKASKTDLESLETTVSGKASQTDLESLTTVVSGKAAQTDLDNLTTAVNGKASQTDLDALSTTVSGKASQSDLDALETTVGDKADKSALESLSDTVDLKLNKSAVVVPNSESTNDQAAGAKSVYDSLADKAPEKPTFTEAETRENLAGSNETTETMWGKVKKVITDFIAHLTDTAAHASLFLACLKHGASPYDSETTYEAGKWVTHNGKLWQSKQSTTGNEPAVDSAYWADMSDVSSLFSSENTSLTTTISQLSPYEQDDDPTTEKTTEDEVETTTVTADPHSIATVTIPAPDEGNTTALEVSITGVDTYGVRNVILDVTNADTENACPIGIANTGAVPKLFDGTSASIDADSRAIVTITKLAPQNEWLITVNRIA